ncbi:MAG: TonB-dependent receptor [Acidobacteria bacterium]|nr:TonB-dependent receptor [Acidobacteriota bacterium]
MTNRWFARLFLVLGLAVPLMLVSVPPLAAQDETAQTDEAVAQAEEEGVVRLADEVTVTGSLIPRHDLSSLSPVSVVDVEEVTYQGTGRIEDLVQNLPQVFASQNASVSNGASGTATVQLRNLGAVRTLALLNGRRMPAGDVYAPAADLNFIPTALIQRVDVLTGGAGSVYGADAVAGVVNFVLDTEFEGVRGEVHWNGFQHNNSNDIAQQLNQEAGFTPPSGNIFNDGGVNFNVAVGGKIGGNKGHAMAFVDFRDIKAIWKDQRDYTNCSVSNLSDTGAQCSGSSTIPDGRFFTNFGTGDYVTDPANGFTNTFRPREGGDVYNYGPLNFMQRNDRKWTGGGFARYSVNDHFEVYAEAMVMDNVSDAQIAPTGTFYTSDHINCDNPMFSDQQRALICGDQTEGNVDFFVGKRNVEGGNRYDHLQHTNWRLVGGVRGDINSSWSYDVYGMRATVNTPESYRNDMSINRLQDSLLVVGDRNDPSTWECQSGTPGCAPYNLFTNLGSYKPVANVQDGITQEALDYIGLVYLYNGGTATKMVNGTLRGDLESAGIMFPSATEAVQVAVGGEYRNESLFFTPDEVNQFGGATGAGGASPAVDGEYSLKEGFAELLVPVVQDTEGFQDLSLELGFRYSNYQAVGQDAKNNSSWKTMLSWAPINGLRFRGGFNRAVRAPNVRELFVPNSIGLGGSEDICAGPNPAFSFEQCARTGVTAAQYGNIVPNPAGQYNSYDGGNAALDVETADTLTAGLVWTPRSITGLSLTVDYYDIKIKNTISSFAPDDVIRACAGNGDPELCGLIHRDVRGTLWLIGTYPDGAYTVSTNQNIGEFRARGVDVSGAYPWNLGDAGYINFSFVGTASLENSIDNPLVAYDCSGYMGNQCGLGRGRGPEPKWRHRMRATWNTNFNTSLTLGWRLFGSVTNDDFSDDPDLRNEGTHTALIGAGSDKFPTYNWFDFAATYTFSDGLNVSVGVNNLLDKDPPLGAGLEDVDYGPGYYGQYDYLGRAIYANLQFAF